MKPRLLVAYSLAGVHVQATLDYICALKKHADYEVEYIHVTHGALLDVDLDAYDVVFHSYCARVCFEGYISESYKAKLRAYRGVKVLAVQDEYDLTNVLKCVIKDLGFDIVLTCVPQGALEYVYPRSEFENVRFVTVLTGYIPDETEKAIKVKPLSERMIFLGYRGRDLGPHYGRLGYDKIEIGRGMKRICDARGIATDIAWDEDSRIYGDTWAAFVGNCRAMLGVESGSNVFDFDGSLRAKVAQMTKDNGGRRPTYEEFLPVIEAREREIDMGQISPRVFECAMMRTPMVLFRGRYSDAIQPDLHYVLLEKDLSNADEVLAKLEDLDALSAMADRAYEHLVGSGRFSYSKFCRSLQSIFADVQQVKNWCPRQPGLRSLPTLVKGANDLKKQILREVPTSFPGSEKQFQEKQTSLSAIATLLAYEASVTKFSKMLRAYIASAEAHIRILESVTGRIEREFGAGLTDSERASIQHLSETCQSAFLGVRRNSEKIRKVYSRMLAIGFDGTGEEAGALSDCVLVAGKAWFDGYSEFFSVIGEQLYSVHGAIRVRVAHLAEKRGRRAAWRFRVLLWAALLKAPPIVAGSFMLRAMPATRRYLKEVRNLVKQRRSMSA